MYEFATCWTLILSLIVGAHWLSTGCPHRGIQVSFGNKAARGRLAPGTTNSKHLSWWRVASGDGLSNSRKHTKRNGVCNDGRRYSLGHRLSNRNYFATGRMFHFLSICMYTYIVFTKLRTITYRNRYIPGRRSSHSTVCLLHYTTHHIVALPLIHTDQLPLYDIYMNITPPL